MFAAPPVIETEIFARVPDKLWKRGGRRHSILEGPSFDRAGNLYTVNIPHGLVMKVTPAGEFSVVAEYDGEPNGLKIHKDGRIFIADHNKGVVQVDPATGAVKVVQDKPNFERFKGLNDLVFNSAGELYVTDQGESGLHDPTGRVWMIREGERPRLLLGNVPSPNGLVITPDDKFLYLAVTRANAIWRVPLRRDGVVGRVGTFIQMSGGTGPDGMAFDQEGSIVVAHPGMGSVWQFSRTGRPLAEIRCTGMMPTNVAYGGADGRTLYITEAETGSIQIARLEVPGQPMYSHL